MRGKGVDVIAVLAFNDAWVMSAWGKANGVQREDIVCVLPVPTISRPLSPLRRMFFNLGEFADHRLITLGARTLEFFATDTSFVFSSSS